MRPSCTLDVVVASDNDVRCPLTGTMAAFVVVDLVNGDRSARVVLGDIVLFRAPDDAMIRLAVRRADLRLSGHGLEQSLTSVPVELVPHWTRTRGMVARIRHVMCGMRLRLTASLEVGRAPSLLVRDDAAAPIIEGTLPRPLSECGHGS